jgi:hypothetical protein
MEHAVPARTSGTQRFSIIMITMILKAADMHWSVKPYRHLYFAKNDYYGRSRG